MNNVLSLAPGNGTCFPRPSVFAKNRFLKSNAIRLGLFSAFGVSLICLYAGLSGSTHGFTATIEWEESLDGVYLKSRAYGEGSEETTRFLNVEGLNNAKPTDARSVLSYCEGLESEDLWGRHVYVDANETPRAFHYTFFIENISEESKEFTFRIQLDSFHITEEDGVMNPYTYLRIVLIEKDMQSHTPTRSIYGALNDLGQGTVEGGTRDLRECISSYQMEDNLRIPTFHDGDNGFCEPFRDDHELIREERDIEAGRILRYSIVAYFEGYDPDCRGSFPHGASVTLSAHIGG